MKQIKKKITDKVYLAIWLKKEAGENIFANFENLIPDFPYLHS